MKTAMRLKRASCEVGDKTEKLRMAFFIALVVLVGGLRQAPTVRAEGEQGLTMRQIAWGIGEKAALIVMGHMDVKGEFVPPSMKTEILSAFQRLSAAAGISVKPLPRMTGNPRIDVLALHSWARGNSDESIGGFLRQKHGAEHAALYELALSSTLLMAAEDFGSTVWRPYLEQMRNSAAATRLDPALVTRVMTLVDLGRKPIDVHMALQRMHADVRAAMAGEEGERILVGSYWAAPPRSSVWMLGMTACMATMSHINGEITGSWDTTHGEMIAELRRLTTEFGLSMPVLPQRDGQEDPWLFYARAAQHLMQAWAPPVSVRLRERHGMKYARLFEIPLKVNWLLSGKESHTPEMITTVSSFLKRASREAELPEEIWSPFVALLDLGGSSDAIMKALEKLDVDALEYLDRLDIEARADRESETTEKPDATSVQEAIDFWILARDVASALLLDVGRPMDQFGSQTWVKAENRTRELGLTWPAWPNPKGTIIQRAKQRWTHVSEIVVPDLYGQVEATWGAWHAALFSASYSLGLFHAALAQGGDPVELLASVQQELEKASLPDTLWSTLAHFVEEGEPTMILRLEISRTYVAVIEHLENMKPATQIDRDLARVGSEVWTIALECFEWACAEAKGKAFSGDLAKMAAEQAARHKKEADAAAGRIGIELKWPLLVAASDHLSFHTLAHVLRFFQKDARPRYGESICALMEFAVEAQYFRLGDRMEEVVGALGVYLGPPKPLIVRQAETLERLGLKAGLPSELYSKLITQARDMAGMSILTEAVVAMNKEVWEWLRAQSK